MSIPEQRVPLHGTAEPPGDGLRRAARNADPWWASNARRAIEVLARTGREFSADDLRDHYGIGDPDSPGRWGAVFRQAAADGVIRPVGAVPSRRPSRCGGLTRTWSGTRSFRDGQVSSR